MLTQPFWFFSSYVPARYQGGDLFLQRLYLDLLKAYGEDHKEVHQLRSDLLRLFEVQKAKDLPPEVDLLRTTTEDSKLMARIRLATRFLSSVGGLVPGYVPGVDTADIHEELMEILQIAACICFKIHTQRNGWKCEGIKDLPSTFSHDSSIMEAHSLHTTLLSDDPKALDEKLILLISQPKFAAIGKADGSKYDGEPRMLKKAIVLMG
ncbi:hypothetical protein FKW77_009702 [Venturia effusa]|uniref:Uncharacterized protein n=1 Tax=Venturia effusa TaxID=50376 RepID=A0A517L0B1_9PEZI|nr:hypothetical protein FKW77_009702 [Venturia effusa]